MVIHAGWPKDLAGLEGQFLQAYRRHQTHNKLTAAAHGYDASAHHAKETESQIMTTYTLQALANANMEDK